jgi:hypothetical protein
MLWHQPTTDNSKHQQSRAVQALHNWHAAVRTISTPVSYKLYSVLQYARLTTLNPSAPCIARKQMRVHYVTNGCSRKSYDFKIVSCTPRLMSTKRPPHLELLYYTNHKNTTRCRACCALNKVTATAQELKDTESCSHSIHPPPIMRKSHASSNPNPCHTVSPSNTAAAASNQAWCFAALR